MNSSFLLPLAAHRAELRHDSHNISQLRYSEPNGVGLRRATQQAVVQQNSDTCTISVDALEAALRQCRRPQNNQDVHSAQAANPAACSAASLAAPPAAATVTGQAAQLEGSPPQTFECRICLTSEPADSDLVQPCSCRGTLSYTHLSCLSKWVDERGSMTCELCGQRYKQPYANLLEPIAAAAALRIKQAGGWSAYSRSLTQRGPMTRVEWCALLLALFLLALSFLIISVIMSRVKATAHVDSHTTGASTTTKCATDFGKFLCG